jgi:hypothetical protein
VILYSVDTLCFQSFSFCSSLSSFAVESGLSSVRQLN